MGVSERDNEAQHASAFFRPLRTRAGHTREVCTRAWPEGPPTWGLRGLTADLRKLLVG